MDSEQVRSKRAIVFPSDRFLFLDLDMTLIDEARRINVRSIPSCVEKLQHTGWTVGLNSNTPFAPLLVWMRYFGMNGSFMAEKGGVYCHKGRMVYDEALAKRIQRSREALKRRFESMHIQLLLGNPTDVLLEHFFPDAHVGPLVILDSVRMSSVNFYVREITPKKEAVINVDLLKTLVEAVRLLYMDIPSLEEKVDEIHGAMLATMKGQTKRTGMCAFMNDAKLTQVGMIGDSMKDFLGDLAVHYAVGNAATEFQEKAVFVSKYPMARGCEEIMETLLR